MQAHPTSLEAQTSANRIVPQPLVLEKAKPIHFIGAGGVGMSALAKILLEQGFTVSGSDAQDGPYLAMLQALGGAVYPSHDAAHVPADGVIVASTAIKPDNPEIQAAQKQGLPLYHRSDVLREIIKLHPVSIGLTGTHGKTTMTGMTGLVLDAGGLDPTVIAGGKVPAWGSNARTGKTGQYAVAELDESDGTVIQYQPTYSVIANLELDHPDHFQGGVDAVVNTFRHYLDALDVDKTVVFNMDCPLTRQLFEDCRGRLTTIQAYPLSQPDSLDESVYSFQDVTQHLEGGYQGDLYAGEERLGTIWLQVPGRHNLSNAMMAAILGHRLGIPFETIRRALENFSGMGRRFEKLGTYNGALVVDDYAHHPTEVQATLKAAREYNQFKGRVIAMFQPHRYQRLEALWDAFTQAFEDADEVIVLDVYAAGESSIDGIDSQRLAKAIQHGDCEYWASANLELVLARLKTILTPGDLFLTMGAGDITQIGRKLVAS